MVAVEAVAAAVVAVVAVNVVVPVSHIPGSMVDDQKVVVDHIPKVAVNNRVAIAAATVAAVATEQVAVVEVVLVRSSGKWTNTSPRYLSMLLTMSSYSQGESLPVPDAAVTALEDATVAPRSLEGALNNMSVTPKTPLTSEAIEMPPRPGYCKLGKDIVLLSNYFTMDIKKDKAFFRYLVQVKPGADGRVPKTKKLKRLIGLFLDQHFAPAKSQNCIATNYKDLLISTIDLQPQAGPYNVSYYVEGDDPSPQHPVYRIEVERQQTVDPQDLLNYLGHHEEGGYFMYQGEVLQSLNVVVGHSPKSSQFVATIGANRHYNFNIGDKKDLGYGLTAIRGFFVSVRPATNRLLVNVQVKNAAFYNTGQLVDLIREFGYIPNDSSPFTQPLANFLRKLAVNVTHIKNLNQAGQQIPRIRTIYGLAEPSDGRDQENPPRVPHPGANAKQVRFYLGDTQHSTGSARGTPTRGRGAIRGGGQRQPSRGRYVSVFEHFQTEHAMTLKNWNLPVINVGSSKDPVYLPAEVCYVGPGQTPKNRLSAQQTASMIDFAVRAPIENAQSITTDINTNGLQVLGLNPQAPTLHAFGIQVNNKMVAVRGRLLPAANVQYNKGNALQTHNRSSDSWNLNGVRFIDPRRLDNWEFWHIGRPNENRENVQEHLNRFIKICRTTGMAIGPYGVTWSQFESRGPSKVVQDQVARVMKGFSERKPKPSFLVIVIEARDKVAGKPYYNAIKRFADVNYGFLNVCMLSKGFAKERNEQFVANVALKINLKLGGRNHQIQSSGLGFVAQGTTMLVGLDVTHPSPGATESAPSIASIVASVDGNLAQWPARLSRNPHRQEHVDGLDELFRSRLALWKERNKALPQNILLYRDGVSEGQYQIVIDHELAAFKRVCDVEYDVVLRKKGIPRITVVIVGKRHHTRFYPTQESEAATRNKFNTLPGTYVDRGVTQAKIWEFYVQPHTALQGTARPAHYVVVHDEIFKMPIIKANENAADVLASLTHQLCYLFGRATKAVSICPPAYYADLVCDRARLYLGNLLEQPSVDGSPAGGMSERDQATSLQIHPSIADRMFYI